MESRCLGGAGPALRVSGPFSFVANSLPCSAPLTELVAKEAIEPAPPSPGFYSRLFVTPKVTSGWHPVIDLFTPLWLGGRLPLPHGDYPDHSSVSLGRGLDGIPGSPGCLPAGSGASIFSPVPEVLQGGVNLPVSRSLFRPVDGSSGVHPRHAPSPRSCIVTGSGSFGTSTIGWSWLPPSRRLCRRGISSFGSVAS